MKKLNVGRKLRFGLKTVFALSLVASLLACWLGSNYHEYQLEQRELAKLTNMNLVLNQLPSRLKDVTM